MDGIGVDIPEVNGLVDTLNTLRNIDPILRRQVEKEMKDVMGRDVVPFARRLYPSATRVGYWGDWRGGYDEAKVKRGVKVTIRTRSKGEQIAVFRLTQSNAAGAIFATAGKKTSGKKPTRKNGSGNSAPFIEKLARHGKPSRALWPSLLENRDKLEDAVEDATATMMRMIQRELG